MSIRELLDGQGKVAAQFLPTFIQNDLAAPVVIQSEAPATAGNPVIYVEGNAASVVGGSLALVPGSRTGAPAPDAGLTINAQPTGVQVYVGTNTQATNLLQVAGASGLAQVYNAIYNQPLALVPITIGVANFPPAVGNVGEIFRSTTFTGPAQFNQQIQVPKTGWYMLQTEVRVGGAGIVIPNVPQPTALDVPGAITIGFSTGGTNVPYGYQVIAGYSLYSQSDAVFENMVFSNLVLLQAGTNYQLTLVGSPNAGWNLGANGQIKCELISMNQ